jgi:DNA-binding HxlR family transcriptional regulator
MSYDLRRLRLHGLVERVKHHHCYTLTDDGRRFAVFYSKLGDRVLPALFAADQPNASPKIRQALKVIDGCIQGYTRAACLAAAA